MSSRRPLHVRKPLQGFREDFEVEGATSVEESAPCPVRASGDAGSDEEEVSTRGHIQGQRRRSHGDAGGSGDVVRDQSLSPHQQRWKTDAEPDDGLPRPLRFNPKRIPGVQPPLNTGNPSPGEIFSHFFDGAVFRLICENTNNNAAKNQEKGRTFTWTDISPDEMKKFIGMLLYMSVLDLPEITDYWGQHTIFNVPFPATVMTQDQFMAILSNLHTSDPQKNEENEQKTGTECYDYLHQVRPLIELICTNSQAIYHPKQHLSVDKRMVGTKARLGIKRHMKVKPTKWGLKFFVLADTDGYTIDFKLYTSKSKAASGRGLSFDVVTNLVNKGYLGSGYVVHTDNFYTSPHLLQHLRQQGFGACETHSQGRDGVPTTQVNALTRRSPQGSIQWIRDRDLLFVKWMDTREVSLCSTVNPVYSGDTVQRWQEREYNKYMGGVETSDQMIGTNSVHWKTRRWPTTVFQHLVDIAVTNSFVIHKACCDSLQERPMSRQQFQEELVAHLLGVDLKTDLKKTTGQHLPVPTSCGQTGASTGQGQCKLCTKSTPWRCETCDVGLCLQPDRNCYWQHHQGL